MTIQVGDKLPTDVTGFVLRDKVTPVTLGEITAGKKAVIFGIPGAFTSPCTKLHLPSFVRTAAQLQAKGVDAIVCLSTNDVFVLQEWNKQYGSDQILMLSDGNGAITRALDLGTEITAIGLGFRTRRFAMIVENGVVTSLELEPPGGGCTVSAGEAVLEKL